MNKTTLLQSASILGITLLAGIFFNLSNPNRIQFIGDEKTVDFSESDSLLMALHIQDSLQKIADSIKTISSKREDSLKIAYEKKMQDSLLNVRKQDSIKNVKDSLAAILKNKEDSVKNAQNFSKPVDIKLDFAKALFDKKYRFIDSRDPADYNAGHVAGAMNIPFHEIESYRNVLEGLPKEQVYVVYCSAACDVSIDLAYYMAKMGFKKTYIFHGGWDEWLEAGYPAN
ncbi:MAG TPA: rhodanese-like domain-containing protein [Ignavibacteria bacterium]|nr:rhodanese-like domain-containing protein [Ignavibacteria bacterium]